MALSESDWSTLLSRIKAGKCVPFIGAGANYGFLPLGGTLAKQLLDAYESIAGTGKCSLNPKHRTNLVHVTQFLAVVQDDSLRPKEMICDIINRGPHPAPDADEPHEVLAGLELPIYITTNYDDNMKLALERPPRGKQVAVEVCQWNERMKRQSAFDDPNYRPDADHPLVFHLHGRANDPESVVATEEDYLDFMVHMSKGLSQREADVKTRPPFPSVVISALQDTLLFVGYTLSDFNLKVILRALSYGFGPRKVFGATVQYDDGDLIASPEYLEQYFKFALHLSVFWGKSREFMADLKKRRGP
jgi:hypothetical protein